MSVKAKQPIIYLSLPFFIFWPDPSAMAMMMLCRLLFFILYEQNSEGGKKKAGRPFTLKG